MPTLFDQNLSALRVRYPQLARELSQLNSVANSPPARLPPEAAQKMVESLAPQNNYLTPVLIIGLDHGYLEEKLHQVPCQHPLVQGYRAPIYLLCSTLERLAFVLRERDWGALLSDPRFFLFVGSNAAKDFQIALQKNPQLPWPEKSVNVESGILPPGIDFNGLIDPIKTELNNQCIALMDHLKRIYAHVDQAVLMRKLSAGGLRVLGITSRFTTFLQHSMRDWLGGMRKLGHETRLLVEESNHELLNTLSHAQACVDFRPDLILLIDHTRSSFATLPRQIPSVMWVQDLLPNIFNAEAGSKQSPLDFCIGYGRMRCVAEFGYPESRFMPAVVGVNEQRFAPRKLTTDEQRRFDCDVCYVGHTGPIAEQIVREQIAQMTDPAGPRFLWDIYERMLCVYELGGFIADPLHVQGIIRQSMAALNISVAADNLQAVNELFSHRVNYSLFRHQALQWLLDLDLNIHLYGKGWENHPTLSRFAKGVADNQKHLSAIYQAAKINLQIAPHGIVHQRLFEGLCAGGFFLVRHRPGDVVERIHRPLWRFCEENGICNDAELKQRATPAVRHLLDQLHRCIALDPFKRGFELLADLRLSADSGFAQSAGTLWPEQYDQVAFASQNDLRHKVHHYLQHPDQRRAIGDQMRQIVVERMTYTATSRRLLEFIKQNLQTNAMRMAA